MYIIKRGDFEMDIDPLSCAAINVVEFGPFWRAGIIKRDVIFCFFSPAVGEDEREMVELVNFKPEFSSTFTSMSKENLPTIKILIQTKLDTPTDGYHIVHVDRLRIVKQKLSKLSESLTLQKENSNRVASSLTSTSPFCAVTCSTLRKPTRLKRFSLLHRRQLQLYADCLPR